ncbi:MAG: phosphoglucosamine mutase [Candidatus Aminicenantes bacterium]|nr:phosphoglucosamine mutase [Candidatus Aminicenantes bacterium]
MRLFGTDGIRGKPWDEPLSRDTIIKIGYVVGKRYPRVLIVRDTRNTGEEIEELLAYGITEAGGEAVSSGILPTSALSYLVPKFGFSSGISISASHNPFWDNGIKIVGPDGKKLSLRKEQELEEEILALKILRINKFRLVREDLKDEYKKFLVSRAETELKGMKVILDSANGAAYEVASEVFSYLGAKVEDIGNSPDGRNINITGAVHPENLAWRVKSKKASIGFAFDGDADRCIWMDEKGNILTGDHTLFLFSSVFNEERKKWNRKVVGTVMSNLALEKALKEMGIEFIRAPVGDRLVFAEMVKSKAILGGEESGHTIFREILSTGDGLLTAVLISTTLKRRGEKPSLWGKKLKLFPQFKENIPVTERRPLEKIDGFKGFIEELRKKHKECYFLIRFSGTENFLRITVQGRDKRGTKKALKEALKGMREILRKENILKENI